MSKFDPGRPEKLDFFLALLQLFRSIKVTVSCHRNHNDYILHGHACYYAIIHTISSYKETLFTLADTGSRRAN